MRDAPKSREFLRCALCGKVSRGPSFDVGAREGHQLQVLTQHFVGGRQGMVWTRRPAERVEIEVLEQCARAVVDRLRAMLGLPRLVEQRPDERPARASLPARTSMPARASMPTSVAMAVPPQKLRIV